jgi:hypothetical protein
MSRAESLGLSTPIWITQGRAQRSPMAVP